MGDALIWWQAFVARYGPVGAGLLIGTAAKYSLSMKEDRRVTWRTVASDLLLLGMLGLIALTFGDVATLFGIKVGGDGRVLSGALAAVASDRIVRLVVERYVKKIDDTLGGALGAAPSSVGEVPAGIGTPDAVSIQSGVADHPAARAGAALQAAFRRPTRQRPPEDQIELLRRLDKQERSNDL